MLLVVVVVDDDDDDDDDDDVLCWLSSLTSQSMPRSLTAVCIAVIMYDASSCAPISALFICSHLHIVHLFLNYSGRRVHSYH